MSYALILRTTEENDVHDARERMWTEATAVFFTAYHLGN
jgi:hypothetical protein